MIAARLTAMVLVSICLSALWVVGQDRADDPVRADDLNRSVRVRFDAAHSHTWIESPPQPGLNQYHLLAGPSRAAQALVAMGWGVDVQLGAWDESSLNKIDLVVLNLVSADRPAFRVSEILAIVDFVRKGGGLIVITDHTNCYFHNHVLEALFDQLDLKLTNETACETPPGALSQGAGWILVDAFGDHPMVKGIEHVGIQTGGTVDERFGVAWTSRTSWGDVGRIPMYGEGKGMGFLGNFQKDPEERQGPLPVVAAKEFGAGRIVVIGDQNAIGGFFLNYADNRRLWLQSALWASGQKEQIEASLANGLAGESGRSLIWCVEPMSEHPFYWGSTDRGGYYHAFGLLNKHADARATDRDLIDAKWMVVPSDRLMQKDRWRIKTREFLKQPNKHAVVWMDQGQIPEQDWVGGLLQGKTTTMLETEMMRIYTCEDGSTLQLWKQAQRWSNGELLGPEATRNDEDYRREEALLDPMWKLGLKRMKAFHETIDWLDEQSDQR